MMAKRLLLVDPIPTHRIRLKAALRAAQYDITSVDRIACVTGALAVSPIDLILLNTSGTDPAQSMARLVRAIGPTDIPVLCRDDEAGPLRRMQALSTGACDMIATSIPETLLLARLRGILRDAEAISELERRRVAAASFGFREAAARFDAEGQVIRLFLGSPSSDIGAEIKSASHHMTDLTREELLRDDGSRSAPAAIVLNVAAEAADELDAVLPEIRSRSHLRQASVIVVHPKGVHDIAVRALNLGASEIAEQGSTDLELGHRIETMLSRKRVRDALRRSTEESFRLATTDPLTGLFNRRYSEVYLSDAFVRAGETGRPLTIMMADIDHFKSVNDSLGHGAGDEVLIEVSARIRDNLRAMDMVSRHGGEEFLIILPDIEGSEAELAAERLRASIAGTPIRLSSGVLSKTTISIGVAVSQSGWLQPRRLAAHREDDAFIAEDQSSSLIAKLLASADAALYAAKRSGRNCISISQMTASAA
jgi:two-component system cell cycle response regulator